MFRPLFRLAHNRAAAFSVFALSLLLCANLAAQPASPLSLEQARQIAQTRSAQIPAQESAANASREMAVAAGQLPDPTLKMGLSNLPVDGVDRFTLSRDFMTMRTVAVMQEFTRGDKRAARAFRLEQEARLAEANRDLVIANLNRETAIAWLERFYSERMRALLIQQRDEAKLQIEASDSAYGAGRGSQSDVFAARAAVAQIEDRIAQVDRQLLSAKARLARWVGEAAERPLASPPAMDQSPVNPAQLDDGMVHHTQIALLLRQEGVAQADVAIARSNKRADWSAELMFSQRGSAYSNMISLNVSIPLQWDQVNRQDRELAAKLAMAAQARAMTEEATRDHAVELRMMAIEWQSNRDRLLRHDNALLPLAAERTRAALAAYRGGAGPLGSVLEARRAEIEARMERLRLEMDTARVWAQLYFASATVDDGNVKQP